MEEIKATLWGKVGSILTVHGISGEHVGIVSLVVTNGAKRRSAEVLIVELSV